MRAPLALAPVALALAAGACGGGSDGGLPVGSEPVSLDPADFTTRIDNRFWPMAPGTTWTYRATDAQGDEQRIVVTVTDRTKTVLGIEARVVHDVATEAGAVVEDTYDWYAQDADGNVWYLGEDTKELDQGKIVSTEGSWEAGVEGAQPGIVMPARPEPGLAYREEYYAGHAEDAAAVLSVDERVETAMGWYTRALMTKEFTPLHPEDREYKFYAAGVGPVLAIAVSGGRNSEELVDIRYG